MIGARSVERRFRNVPAKPVSGRGTSRCPAIRKFLPPRSDSEPWPEGGTRDPTFGPGTAEPQHGDFSISAAQRWIVVGVCAAMLSVSAADAGRIIMKDGRILEGNLDRLGSISNKPLKPKADGAPVAEIDRLSDDGLRRTTSFKIRSRNA